MQQFSNHLCSFISQWLFKILKYNKRQIFSFVSIWKTLQSSFFLCIFKFLYLKKLDCKKGDACCSACLHFLSKKTSIIYLHFYCISKEYNFVCRCKTNCQMHFHTTQWFCRTLKCSKRQLFSFVYIWKILQRSFINVILI